MTDSTPPRPLIIWCHPRSCSTAFERAFIQRDDTKVLHEPLGDPFYFGGPTRPCRRYNDEECKERAPEAWEGTIESVMRDILDNAKAGVGKTGKPLKFVVIKDMAQYITPASILHQLHPSSELFPPTDPAHAPIDIFSDVAENPTSIPTSLLREFTHTFLIRTPEKSVPSYWKCVQEGASGFVDWDGSEAGYYELLLLYSYIANTNSTFHNRSSSSPQPTFKQPMPPPLLSASDLLHDPHAAIQQYCEATGVPFDEGMLSWDSGEVQEFKRWEGYHKDAEQSTGFRKEGEDADVDVREPHLQSPPKIKEKKELPEIVKKTINANIAAFHFLYERRTIKTNGEGKVEPDTPAPLPRKPRGIGTNGVNGTA